jgi:hypothetical protein
MTIIVDHINTIFNTYYGVRLNQDGKDLIKKWIDKYSVDDVLEAVEMAFEKFDDAITILMAMGIILHQRQKLKDYFVDLRVL